MLLTTVTDLIKHGAGIYSERNDMLYSDDINDGETMSLESIRSEGTCSVLMILTIVNDFANHVARTQTITAVNGLANHAAGICSERRNMLCTDDINDGDYDLCKRKNGLQGKVNATPK